MMKRFFLRRSNIVDPEDINKQTAEVNLKLEREGPRMNALATWLENRKDKNGFGTDFEYTLRPKGAA